MFYNIFLKLCNDRGISPSAAALDMGFTKAANTKWAAGKTPRDATLAKIAEYFNVSVEYLKGEEGETDYKVQKKNPAQMDGAGVDARLREIWNDSTEAERKAIVSFYETIRGLRGKTE